MWTRAPSITSCVVTLDHEEEVGGASRPRFHHRGSGSNHQPGEQELRLLQDRLEPESSALDSDNIIIIHTCLDEYCSPAIHHDLPKPPGSSKRSLPGSSSRPRTGFVRNQLAPMSTPEPAGVLATRVRQLREPPTPRTSVSTLDSGVRKAFQLDDMQTQIGNATHTPASSSSSSDQEVPEVVLPSPGTKRRRLVYNEEPELLNHPPSGTRSCEDSGLSSQHMADLERTSKASTPEGIDSAIPSELVLAPQCASSPGLNQPLAEQENVVEPLQILEHWHLSSSLTVQTRDDDTPSQLLPHIPPDSRIRTHTTKTMANEWLQLSLGSRGQSDDDPQPPPVTAQSPLQSTSPEPPGIRDFFSSEATSSHRHPASASPYRPQPAYSGESSKAREALPRPLFLEPRPPRGASDQFTAGSSFTPQQFSNLPSLPYHPARVLQPVRSEQSTDTTSVHAWRSSHESAGPSSYNYAGVSSSSGAPWTVHEPPNPAEFPGMGTPASFRDWRSSPFSTSMQQPGVDPEQAWRNLLQRVGTTINVPVGTGFAARAPESMSVPMLPPGDQREEYLDALKRAVDRFQGADQGGKEAESLTELQRLHRSAGALFPHGGQFQQQRPHHPGQFPFDPATDTSLARFYTASRPRAAPAGGPASSQSRRILHPHASRSGLWFTLQASNSQPEASPLQQIPTAYIRVVDDTMTVAAVRRYLANKLSLASEDEVELTCKGQPLQPSLSLHQVRDGIWQSPNTNTPNPNTPQLLSEGKAWKAPDGSITLVGDVVMVLTYGRRLPQQQHQAPPVTSS